MKTNDKIKTILLPGVIRKTSNPFRVSKVRTKRHYVNKLRFSYI